MNRDEGQYFLSHVFDEILMKKKTPNWQINWQHWKWQHRRQKTVNISLITVMIKATADCRNVHSKLFYLDQNLRNFCLPTLGTVTRQYITIATIFLSCVSPFNKAILCYYITKQDNCVKFTHIWSKHNCYLKVAHSKLVYSHFQVCYHLKIVCLGVVTVSFACGYRVHLMCAFTHLQSLHLLDRTLWLLANVSTRVSTVLDKSNPSQQEMAFDNVAW